MDKRMKRRRSTLLMMSVSWILVLAITPGCGQKASVTDPLASTSQQLKVSSDQNNAKQFFYGAENSNVEMETSSLVIPAGVDMTNCPNGRAFVSHGGSGGTRSIEGLDLNCLGDPSASGCTPHRVDQLTLLAQLGTIGSRVVGGPHGPVCAVGTPPVLTYFDGGADTQLIRLGGSTILFATAAGRNKLSGTPPCFSGQVANNVNVVAKSTNCGQTWTTSMAVDNGNGTGTWGPSAPVTGSTHWCSNLDFQKVYRDPFRMGNDGNPRIYLVGSQFDTCNNSSPSRAVTLYRSMDSGQTFQWVNVLTNDANPIADRKFFRADGITSNDDQTLVVYGHGSQGTGMPETVKFFYSRDLSDQTFNVFAPTGLPQVDTIAPAPFPVRYPAGLESNGELPLTLSNYRDSTLNSAYNYNYYRVAYSMKDTSARQKIVRTVLQLPRNGINNAPLIREVDAATLARLPTDPDKSMFHVNFIEPTPFDGLAGVSPLPSTSVLFWEEANHATNMYDVLYSVVTGLENYTPPAYLNVVNGGFVSSWVPNPNAGGNWGGEFDLGSFFVQNGDIGTSVNTYRYFAQWSQTHGVGPNAHIHYNTIQATEPKFTNEQIDNTMTLGTDPAAAFMAVNHGTPVIYAIATDTTGHLKRKVAQASDPTSWSGWADFGPPGTGTTNRAAAAVSWGTGRLDIVALGINDKQMYLYPEQDGAPSNWYPLGAPTGGFAEAPSIASPYVFNLFVVGVGQDGTIYYRTYHNGPWTDWTPLAGGVSRGAVSAVSLTAGRVDVFARDTNNMLDYYVAVDDGTATWEGKGTWYFLPNGGTVGTVSASPAAVVTNSGRMDFFAGDLLHPNITGAGDSAGHSQIDHGWWDGSWSLLHTVGGVLQKDTNSQPNTSPYTTMSAVKLNATQVRLLYRGADNHLWWLKNK